MAKPEVQSAVFEVGSMVCKAFSLAEDPENVCPGMVKLMGKPILDTLSQVILTEHTFCNEWTELCFPGRYYVKYESVLDYSERVLEKKPAHLKNDDFVNKLYQKIGSDKKKRKTLKMVHISDVHIDSRYEAGTQKNCDSYVCCRPEFGRPEEKDQQAGPWGAYKCDLPE